MNQTTTLKAIKAAGACEDGYKKLLNNLGKKQADSKPLTLEEIYNSNGLNDALWCARLMPDVRPLVVQFAAACARRVLHIYETKHPGDDRPRKAIETAENNRCYRAAARGAADAAAAAYARAAAAARVDEMIAQNELFKKIFFNKNTAEGE